MEHVAVRRVGIIAAIDFARHDDAHRRLLLFHRAHLHRRGVRAQQALRPRARRRLHVKRVHVVARGMVLGNVERLEVVVRRLDFRPFDHRVAERKKNPLDFLERLPQQDAASRAGASRPARKDRSRSRASAAASAAASTAPAAIRQGRASMCACSSLRACPTARFRFGWGRLSQFSVMRVSRAGFAAEPSVAQFFPCAHRRAAAAVSLRTALCTSANKRATPSASATPSSASVFAVGSFAIERAEPYAFAGAVSDAALACSASCVNPPHPSRRDRPASCGRSPRRPP